MENAPIVDRNRGLGKVIRALRKSSGLTQSQLAQLAGLERTSICNIERGRQMLTVESINSIAAAMGYIVKVKFQKKETSELKFPTLTS